jgi:GH35 family endo-1,4-beta-xylanase
MSSNGDPKEKRYISYVLKWHVIQNSCFKFVVKGTEEVQELFVDYINAVNIPKSRIWIMVMAGSRVEHIKNAEAVAEFCKQNGLKMSPRLHLLIWDKALKV